VLAVAVAVAMHEALITHVVICIITIFLVDRWPAVVAVVGVEQFCKRVHRQQGSTSGHVPGRCLVKQSKQSCTSCCFVWWEMLL
jgi:hypothetical protein